MRPCAIERLPNSSRHIADILLHKVTEVFELRESSLHDTATLVIVKTDRVLDEMHSHNRSSHDAAMSSYVDGLVMTCVLGARVIAVAVPCRGDQPLTAALSL